MLPSSLLHYPKQGYTLKHTAANHDHDLDLINQITSGNQEALSQLYSLYGQRLYAYALRLTGIPAVAEDIIQDTLVIVWQDAHRFRGEGKVLAWLLGIVHHTAMKALRQSTRIVSNDLETNLVNPEPSPEDQFQIEEKKQWLHEGLETLSPEHRAVLELVFYQGLSLKETAMVCRCPVGTIKSRLSYARKQLRGVLSRKESDAEETI